MTGVHPAARVVEERPTIGAVRVFTVRCPWRHTHTVGLTSTSDAFWCAFGAGFYEVTIA